MYTEQVDTIIKTYCKKLKKVDKSKNIPYVVRAIDKIIMEMYGDLHALRNVQRTNMQPVQLDKKGHCC